MTNGPKRFWLIAGPNGVGKTTYAFRNVPAVSGSTNFVNLDEIARGLSPLEPRKAEREAARIVLARARDFIGRREVFTVETTMSGQTHLALMREAKAAGLSPTLLYFSVRDPDICLQRIARRVAEGGHDVPEPIVLRRFQRSHENLPAYCAAADLWRIYEASGVRPCLAAEGQGSTVVHRDADSLAGANDYVRGFVGQAGGLASGNLQD
ncbi:AAA family ATPase [Mesorhizobium yinganensis]|uniref:AAA family ATPase n=1 Tax=Mesorhizobium yinganensis TaxID=3157707 RepID=UPI0032B816CD